MSVITNRDGDHIKGLADMLSEEKRSPDAPRVRQLDVRDDHVLELLTGITEIIRLRKSLGFDPGLPALEILASLTAMARS